jgi:ABC-type branched-subunit amino acid transport system substrate-binding protein
MRRVLGLVAVGSALAACGTRLPDQFFRPVVRVDGASALSAAATGVAPSVTSGPAAAAVATTAAAAIAGPVVVATSAGPAVVRPTAAAATTSPPAGRATTKAPPARVSAKPNWASDRGVTAQTITIGNIVSRGGIFGTEQFAKQQYGVQAFFSELNLRGGINGRRVKVIAYNDEGDGGKNVDVVKQAVDVDKIFAFVGNNVFNYNGSKMVNDAAVPDIAGEPIDGTAYNKWRHFFAYGGSSFPRDDKQEGYPDGVDYGGASIGTFFKRAYATTNAGVVFYDQDDSRRGAQALQREFGNAGITTTIYPVNLGLPNFSNTVAQMQADGVQLVADAMDANGNAKLCQAVEGNSTFLDQLQVKLSTVSTWVQDIPTQFKQTVKCRQKIFVTDSTWNYSDTGQPGVSAFRAAMKKYFPTREGLNAEWSLHGWVAAQWFTDAALACGADLTRACLERSMVGLVEYTAGGLITKSSFVVKDQAQLAKPGAVSEDCLSIAQWDEASQAWATRARIDRDCIQTPYFPYKSS